MSTASERDMLTKKISRDGLCPSLPTNTARYDRTTKVICTPQIVPSPFSSKNLPPYLPLGWQSFIQPEGQIYFARLMEPSIVTEAYIGSLEICEIVSAWIALIEEILVELGIYLTSSCEICINLGEEIGTLKYYFIDHSKRSVFWLDELNSSSVGLPESVSVSHLRHALEANYWSHLEQFPSHSRVVSLADVDELINIMFHGRADQLTSETSTFPYSAEECNTFLQLLTTSRDRVSDSRIVCFVARIWTVISGYRHQIHYGEEVCRLSRTQSITESEPSNPSLLYKALSKLLFDIPESYLARLNDVIVDDLVYQWHWAKFTKAMSADYNALMQWTFPLLIADLLLLPHASQPMIAAMSLALCAIALFLGFVLSRYTQTLSGFSAPEASEFHALRKTKSGYSALALVMGLPRALVVWALLLFSLDCFWVLSEFVNPIILGVCSLVLGSVTLAIHRTLWPRRAVVDDAEAQPIDELPL